MNRKKGIIIGTTGIIIVALALIGFTYGFYLSLISGNESSKKVKVTAGKSKLEYVELSTEVDTIIGPGYTNTKYFAVKNIGDLSASYYLYLVDVENTFIRKNDIVYTIYRKAYDYSEENVEPEEFDINGTYDFSSWENVTNSHCKTVSEFTDYGDCEYPHEKSLLTKQKQTIMEKDDYYVYAFVVTYINQPEIDQIDDAESVFSGVVRVYADEGGTDVSPFEPGTLADAIYLNALNKTNGTELQGTPITTPGDGAGNMVYTSYTDPISFNMNYRISSKWYVFGTEITIDKNGYFKIVNPQIVNPGMEGYSYEYMLNGYITDIRGYQDEASAQKVMNDKFKNVYKVGIMESYPGLYLYEKVTKNFENLESVLSETTDDHGTSYYYRGGVVDNFVNYAGMCWRIVRIVGDGSIKLILEDQYTTCDDIETEVTAEVYTGNYAIGSGTYGYIDGPYNEEYEKNIPLINYLNSKIDGMAVAFENYQKTIENKLKAIDATKTLSNTLKVGDWCYDNSAYIDELGTNVLEQVNSYYNELKEFSYGAYTRLKGNKTASLKCKKNNGESMTLSEFSNGTPMYVGTLTSDEIVFAGGINTNNTNYYLINHYQLTNSDYWWTFSPYNFDGYGDSALMVYKNGTVSTDFYIDFSNTEDIGDVAITFRPAVTLKEGTTFVEGGEGTQSNPYVVE